MTAQNSSRQIAAIDTRIAGHEALIEDARTQGLEILLLSGDGDGIEELAAKLAGTKEVDGLHLFSHGSEGRIHLGDDVLSRASIADHAEALELIRGSFSEEGDLLVYGCDVGAGEQGRQFVDELALVTGADVAASDDLTGARELGGNWDLEQARGEIESRTLEVLGFEQSLAYSGTINFSNVNDPGGTSNASQDAKFNAGSYILIADGESKGTSATAGYAYTGTDETKITFSFTNGEAFDATSLYIYSYLTNPNPTEFSISSDTGSSTSESIGWGTGKTASLSGFTNITKLYVTANSGNFKAFFDDLQVSNVAPAVSNIAPAFDQDADNNGILSDAEAGGSVNLTIAEDSGALDLSSFLQADDPDVSQTLTWSENASDQASPGTLSITSGTVNTPATDELPLSATYTPFANFNGTDTFSIDVSDGTNTDTLQMTVTVTDAPDVTSVQVADGTYGLGDSVTVSVNFDEAVTVISGTPTIDINVGGNIRTVNLDSGDGTTTLTGTYTIQAGDDDSDGIAIGSNAISGNIEDNDGDGNTADLFNNSTNDAGETVDATAPFITGVSIPDSVARVGDAVTVSIFANEAGLSLDTGTVNGVAVTGFIDNGGGLYSASYTVQEGDTDRAAGDDIPVNFILSDAAGNASASYTAAISQSSDAIDANSPTITNVSIPNASVTVGDAVTVTITASEAGLSLNSGTVNGVAVTGFTDNGGGSYSATYTVQDGGTDRAAGDDIPVSFVLADAAGNNSSTYTTAISQGSDMIDANTPSIVSVSVPDAAMKVGDAVTVTITASEAGLSLDSGTVNGVAVTGFTDNGGGSYSAIYTVQEGDTDRAAGDDIPVNFVMSDAAGNMSSTYTTAISQASDKLDANSPTITSVSIPDTTMKVGDAVTVTITASEVGLSLDSGTINGVAITGFTDNGSGNYSATYTVQEGDTDRAAGDDIPVNVILSDAAGNTSATYNTAISQGSDTIDANSPAIDGAITPTSATITDAEVGAGTFTLMVNFDEAMNTGVDPTISFPTGGENPEAATLSSASGSWTDANTYTVTYDVADANEAVQNIDVRVTGAQDSAGNTLSATTQNDLFSIITAPAPVIAGIDSSTTDGTYKVGDSVDVTITFDQAVDFTAGTGELQAMLSNGETITLASADASNQTSLSGTYTIGEGHTDSGNLNVTAVNLTGNAALAANADGIPADVSVPVGNNLADNQALVIDANTPGVTVPNLEGASDSGSSDSDNITNIATGTISGSTEAGATVTVRVDGSSVGTATADGSGDWSFMFAGGDLSEGANAVDIVAEDPAGNISNDSADLTLTLDTTAPTLGDDTTASVQENAPAGTLTGVNGAGDRVTANDTGADTTAPVTAVNGNVSDVASAIAGDNGGLFTVAADGSVSFDPNGEFDALATGDSETTGVTLTIRDAAGNTSNSNLSVQVTGANTIPSLTIGSAPTVSAGQTTTLDDSLLNETDPDDDGADLTYTLTSAPDSGALKLSGIALGAGDNFTQQDVIDGNLTFSADSTTGNVSFDVSLRDDSFGGPANATVTVTVTAPPPPPITPTPDPEPEPEPNTIDGAPATVTNSVDPDTGNPITTFEIEPVTDGNRVDENNATGDVDVDLSDQVRASISENTGLIASRRSGGDRDNLRTVIDRPDDDNRPAAGEINDFLTEVNDEFDIVEVIPTRPTGSQGDNRINVRIDPPEGNDNGNDIAPVVIVDTRQLNSDTTQTVNINGAGSIVIRGSGTFRGAEELEEGGAPDVDNVLGDNSAQTLFFGPGDDIIRGSGGDDVVGSAGGDDHLFGNSGNDTLYGGEGNDLMHGGLDQDVILVEGNRDDYVITQDHGIVTLQQVGGNDVDTLINVETLQFDDQDLALTYSSELSWITTLYDRLLDRQGDLDGVQYWADRLEGSGSFDEIIAGFLNAQEFTSSLGQSISTLNTGAQVDVLYQTLLQRNAEPEGHAYWVDRLDTGVSLDAVATGIALSDEAAGQYLLAEDWEFML